MSPEFLKAYSITMNHEGGYSNNPNDKGGETYKGISRKNFPKWNGWKIIDAFKLDKSFPYNLAANIVLQDEVLDFYYQEFWLLMKLDKILNQPIQCELFDTGVNMGNVTAIKDLQRAINMLNRNQKDFKDISVDGLIGDKTLTAVNSYSNKKRLFNLLNGLQFKRYIEICEKDPSQEEFIGGWIDKRISMI